MPEITDEEVKELKEEIGFHMPSEGLHYIVRKIINRIESERNQEPRCRYCNGIQKWQGDAPLPDPLRLNDKGLQELHCDYEGAPSPRFKFVCPVCGESEREKESAEIGPDYLEQLANGYSSLDEYGRCGTPGVVRKAKATISRYLKGRMEKLEAIMDKKEERWTRAAFYEVEEIHLALCGEVGDE